MKKFFTFVVLLLSLTSIFASTQWEYMVVSLGTPYFVDYQGKSLAYYQEDEDFYFWPYENAASFERELDLLGKQGWELVSVVGAIGGNQEFILKRPYVEEQTKSDKELAETNVQGLMAKESDAFEFVELDEAAKQAATKELIDANNGAMKQSLEALFLDTSYIHDDFYVSYNEKYDYYFISIRFNFTNDLLIGKNGYRKVQAEEKANEVYGLIKSLSAKYPETDLSIYYDIYIESEGKRKTVVSKKAEYSYGWTAKTGGEYSWSLSDQ